MSYKLELLIDGLNFGEGPRWHNDELWYSDFYQHAVYSVDANGTRTTRYGDLPDRPSGLGWLPDGTTLVVFMTSRQVMRDDGSGTLVQHADLSDIATGYCNDMVVDRHGNAYVGNFGFDLEARADFAAAKLALVRADGSTSVAADEMRFPNGSVITPDGNTLIVGQTFGNDFVAFDIAADATLSGRRTWATVHGASPDGCTLDAQGGIWVADAVNSAVLRVEEGSNVTDRIDTPMRTFACALGGADGRSLFILCAPGSHPAKVAGDAAGVIYQTKVAYPHAGLP